MSSEIDDLQGNDAHAAEDTGGARKKSGRRRKWLKELLWIAVLLVLLLVSGRLIGAWRAPDLVGEPVEFALRNLDGEVVRLSDFRGRKVVVNFWATWCMPCRVELPTLSRFARKNPDLQVLGLSVQSPPDELKKVAADLPFPTLILDDETGLRLGVNALPSTLVIDEQGRVKHAHSGILFGPQLWWMTRN